MIESVQALDDAVDAFVGQHRRTEADHLWYALSSAADHSLIWLAIGSARAARTGDVGGLMRLCAALGIESFATNVVVKSAFRRVRPPRAPASAAGAELPYGMHVPITSSFPSGHATAAFTAAAFLAEDGSAPATLVWYGLAALVASSRVYVGLHHASDVLAGAALGVGFGAVLRRVLPR